MPSRRNRRSRRGGSGAANPSSYSDAASYMKATVGSGNQQWNNVFEGKGQSNAIVGLEGQKAGKRRSRKASRRKRGGFWGQIINQAIVPFSIFGMQQTFRRKKHGGKGTRKHRRH